MEWLVPILFVLASFVQWWMQRSRQGQEDDRPETPQPRDRRERSRVGWSVGELKTGTSTAEFAM